MERKCVTILIKLIEIMKSRYRTYTLIMCSIITTIIISCYGKSEAISVRRDTMNVGRANVGDSVCATFKFRNDTYATQTVTFLPECDCTTVSAESMELGPHKRGSVEVKVAVESPGEFTKYVYVQAAGGDEFFTVSIKGRGK